MGVCIVRAAPLKGAPYLIGGFFPFKVDGMGL